MSRLARLGYVGTILFGGIHAASSLYWGLGGDACHGHVGSAACWLGAAGLVVYGGAYATLSWLSLSGRLGAVEDRVGLLGHAYLWDPLFVAWGLSLVLALANDGRRRPSWAESS